MHELGVLNQIVRTVVRIAKENKIKKIKFVTIEVGRDSSFVPMFLEKLYPVAIDQIGLMNESELRIVMVDGRSLQIKDIGY
ncbi:MAG: hydrogenase maturation nickel metallochaperone HypA [Lachnospiraceae bacterium]|nr:hydrogenase maturation nickel metallochaperone HypA [Lachnospiraceae bacterium]